MYKTIHYCWFGRNQLPKSAIKCIESWRKYCPDYEIKEWNEDNFDCASNEYIREAYKNKKYAFVSDYARFKILYEHGGVYLDTDVELVKDITTLLENGPYMGCEENGKKNFFSRSQISVNSGLGLYLKPGNEIIKEILDFYEKFSFYNDDGSINTITVVKIVTDILKLNGLKNIYGIQKIGDITIYPKHYFCPLDYYTGALNITDTTYSIHHYIASWQSEDDIKIHKKAMKLIPYVGKSIAFNIVIYSELISECNFKKIAEITKEKIIKRVKKND